MHNIELFEALLTKYLLFLQYHSFSTFHHRLVFFGSRISGKNTVYVRASAVLTPSCASYGAIEVRGNYAQLPGRNGWCGMARLPDHQHSFVMATSRQHTIVNTMIGRPGVMPRKRYMACCLSLRCVNTVMDRVISRVSEVRSPTKKYLFEITAVIIFAIYRRAK